MEDLTEKELEKIYKAATEYPDDNMTFWNTDVARLIAEVRRRRAAAKRAKEREDGTW